MCSEIGLDRGECLNKQAFWAWLGSPARDHGRARVTTEDIHNTPACRPGLSAGRASGRTGPQWFGHLRAAYAGTPWSGLGHRGHGPHDRTDGLGHAPIPDPMSCPKPRRIYPADPSPSSRGDAQQGSPLRCDTGRVPCVIPGRRTFLRMFPEEYPCHRCRRTAHTGPWKRRATWERLR